MISLYKNWLIAIEHQATSATAMSPSQNILIEINTSESIEAAFEEIKSKIEIIEACPIPFSVLSHYIDRGFQALQL